MNIATVYVSPLEYNDSTAKPPPCTYIGLLSNAHAAWAKENTETFVKFSHV